MNPHKNERFWAYAFLSPVLILFGLFLLLPVLLAVLFAFKDITVLRFQGAGDFLRFLFSDYVGWRNFSDALDNPVFYTALKNTFLYTAVMVPLSVSISLVLATLASRLGRRLQRVFVSAYYLPGIFSAVVLAMVWRWLMEPDKGLLNLALNLVGVDGPNWLGNPHLAIWSIVLVGAMYAPGFGVLLYTAAIGRIPIEMEEAVRMDGANSLQRWIHIVLPVLKPTTLYLVVMNTIWSFQVFTSIYIMTRGGPGDSTMTLVYHIYDLAFEQAGRKGEAAAVALILVAMMALVTALQFRVMRSSTEY
jgi:multiple sugar transport system permease protein